MVAEWALEKPLWVHSLVVKAQHIVNIHGLVNAHGLARA